MAEEASLIDYRKADYHVRNFYPMIPYTFKWTLENFTLLPKDFIVESVDLHTTPECTCVLKCTTTKNQTTQLPQHNIYASMINKSEYEGCVIFDVSLLDSSLNLLEEIKNRRFDISATAESQELYLFCFPCDASRKYSIDESAILVFRMQIYGLKQKIQDVYPRNPIPKQNKLCYDSLKTLAFHQKTMRKSSQYSDVDLCVGDETIHVHKFILHARSPVFAKMLEHEMAEQESKIRITDISFAVLKQLVDFLYSGYSGIENSETAAALYYAADKYEVLDLRKCCGEVLRNKLTTDNACSVCALAERHDDARLKEETMEFICFHFSSIFETPEWQKFSSTNTETALKILSLHYKKFIN